LGVKVKRTSLVFRGWTAIAAGAAMLTSAPAFAAFGTIDTTFGGTPPGFAINELGGDADTGIDVVTGRDDRLYVLSIRCDAATCAADNALVVSSFDADGELRPSFGTGGDLPVIQDVTQANYKLEVDDTNEHIYIAYPVCDATCRLVVERRTFAGSLETTFGTNGVAQFGTQTPNLAVRQLLLQPNGKLLVLIEVDIFEEGSPDAVGSDIAIVRLTSAGGLDPAFDEDGIADVSTLNGCDQTPSITIGRTPTIYYTASQASSCAGPYSPVIMRLTAAGEPDPAFGTNGRIVSNFDQTGDVTGLVAQEQSDGKIAYAMGRELPSDGLGVDIVRLNSNGTQDTSFNAEHGIYQPVDQFDRSGRFAVQTDGKVVFNGRFTTNDDGDQALNRVLGSSSLAHQPRFPAGAPFVGFNSFATEVSESDGTVTITLITSSQATSTITVPFSLAGSATRGLDYTVNTNAFVIPAGASSGSITLTILEDNEEEFDDTILITLGDAAPNGQTAPNRDNFIVTIVDNDFVVVPPPPGDDEGGALGLALLSGLLGLAGLRRIRRRGA
jgi:uncharacterized delta-60 repeat protein